jgi:ATP-dependent helicase/nuclease subunit A
VHHSSGSGFFHAQEIRDVLAVLNLLDNQNQDVPLAAALRSPLVQLPNAEESLANARMAYPDVPFHRAIYQYAGEKDDELAMHLKAFVAQLTTWREAAQRESVADVLTRIYESTRYLTYVSGLHSGQQRVANLLELQDHARRFATFQRQGVSRFMELINQLEAETDMQMPSVESEADNTVRIMSIHGSKGLEFPVVFLPDMGKMINLSDANGSILAERSIGIALHVADPERRVRYPSLASALVHRRIKQQSLAEEMRVLYVAMTRAREHLVLIGTGNADCVDKWRSRWGNWAGPLPAETILGVRTMLDWLGPVWAATEKSDRPIFTLIQHSEQDVATWAARKAQRPKFSPLQEQLSRLEPLAELPPGGEKAHEIIEQIGFIYPHQAMTLVSAAQSITLSAKPVLHDRQSSPPTHAPPDSLPLPTFMLEKSLQHQTIAGVDIGTATHLLLQHLDFARATSAESIDAQIEVLVSQRLLLPAQAPLVDREAVWWFVQSELGKTIRQHLTELRREIPVTYVIPADGGNADDQILIRGRLDLLIPLASGQIIIDYKTDRVDGDAFRRRIDTYRGQMMAYKQAIERITQRPVAEIYLIFLHARRIEAVLGTTGVSPASP